MQSSATREGSPSCSIVEHRVGDLPQDHADVATLLEDGDAESSQLAEREAKIRSTYFLQLALAAFGRDALHQRIRVLGLQRFGVEPAHATVQSKHGRLTDRDMNVAGTLLDAGLQQLVNEDCAHGFQSAVGHIGPRFNAWHESRIVRFRAKLVLNCNLITLRWARPTFGSLNIIRRRGETPIYPRKSLSRFYETRLS